MSSIYHPSEDSYLLSEVVRDYCKKNKVEKALDMGAGSGIQAQTCINSGLNPKNIVLADVNKNAINYLKLNFPDSKIINSNLFSNIKGKFDLIIFNPPYLPEDKHNKEPDTTGGKKGSEIINKFLKQGPKHINDNGIILLLTSNLTKDIDWNNFKKKLLAKKKLFFEELYVLELEY